MCMAACILTWQGPPACALEDGSWLKCQDGTWKALTELKAAGKVRGLVGACVQDGRLQGPAIICNYL